MCACKGTDAHTYRVCRQFHRDFRQIALLGLVQDRFPKSKLAYMAMKLMMENSAPTERKVNQETTASIRSAGQRE